MQFSKDWGSTFTWLAFANLAASTFLLYHNLIAASDWLILNGVGTAGAGGRSIVGKTKGATNGAPPAP